MSTLTKSLYKQKSIVRIFENCRTLKSLRTELIHLVFGVGEIFFLCFKEQRCFSLVLQDHINEDILDLVASSVDERKMWVRGIQLLIKKNNEANLLQQQQRSVTSFHLD